MFFRGGASEFASNGTATWIAPLPSASHGTPSACRTGGTILGEDAGTAATQACGLSTWQWFEISVFLSGALKGAAGTWGRGNSAQGLSVPGCRGSSRTL